MSYTVNDIVPRIAVRLNDRNQTNFTTAKLLPLIQDAADELQLELELKGLLVLEKVFTTITVTAGTKNLGNQLPSDLLEPQRLEERLAGTTDQFVMMVARMWPPDILPTDSLRYWDYREEDIHFVGATQDREVKIYGLKRLLNVTGTTSPINVNNSQTFMITRTAALAARFLGENPVRANALDNEALIVLNKLTSIGMKNKQRTRTRRRPFTLTGRRRMS